MTPSGPSASAADGSSPQAGQRQAAFFDLDKTVIAKAAMAAFRGPLHHGGLLSRRSLLRTALAQLVYLHLGASEQRLERIRASVLKLTKGWERQQVAAVVDETLEIVVEPIIYAEALELIERHHREGRLVVLVSASPEELVGPLGRHLGVDEVIASRAELDEQGRYTGEMDFYAYGPFKAEAIRELAQRLGLDLSASYAYSDSYTDLAMLETVGHPVAVNPDRVLARVARERDFEVLHFVRPVSLREAVRDRVRETQVRPAVAVSLGAVMATAAALTLGWWLGGRQLRRLRQLRREQVIGLALAGANARAPGSAQVVRRRLAAITPAAARAARIRSFFSMRSA